MGALKINLIAAACENMGIGINGNLPWRLKNELQYFQTMTKMTKDSNLKNAVIMGRKTWLGIPPSKRPLGDRLNIILTRDPTTVKYPEDVVVLTSLESAFDYLMKPEVKKDIENVWIVGGSSVYKECMLSPYCNRIYLTKIYADIECDTFFPPISDDFIEIDNCEDVPKGMHEENGLKYEYKVYEKVSS